MLFVERPMRCFTSPISAREGSIYFMPSIGNMLVAGLLLLSGIGEAARTPQQRREQSNPYVILPPGGPGTYGEGKPAQDLGEREFTLRHIYHHGTHNYPDLHRYLDVAPEAQLKVSYDNGETYEEAPRTLRARARTTSIERLSHRKPADIDRILDHAYMHGEAVTLPSYAWTTDDLPGPNITDKRTVTTFAKMAANAYVQDHLGGEWRDVKGGFNYTDDFGWEADGLRGHIFADQTNKSIVIGLKGTSPAVFDGADTTGNDKLNDNLFGSCCCGQGGQWGWKQVCDCMTSTYTCNNTCLVKSLREKSHYYRSVRELYHNVTERYPEVEDIWLSGHSLGGVVSALLGLTYGLPTLTFEAFPDALAASRLGLPTPSGYKIGSHQSRGAGTGIYHFGHTADPIYMGTCNSASSFCTIAGYAFQGACHTGQTCTYDTVGDLGWRVGIGTHKINNVIRDVLEVYDTVPTCETDVDCSDCYNWKFFESNSSDPITTTTSSSSSSSPSTTRTRTETCKTPGWWGCLDETTTSGPTTTTTTSTSSSTSTSSTSSTSTCKTPGWFGCKDPTTTTTTTTSSSSSSETPPATTTTTCETPGWFGCYDPTTTTSVSAEPAKTAVVCATATATTSSLPSASHLPTTRRKGECVERFWYGGCKAYGYKVDLR